MTLFEYVSRLIKLAYELLIGKRKLRDASYADDSTLHIVTAPQDLPLEEAANVITVPKPIPPVIVNPEPDKPATAQFYSFCEGIKEHEGYIAPNSQYPEGSRAWRNRNPGNLRYSRFQDGTAGGFAYFKTYERGWAALCWDVHQKFIGNTSTGLGPEKTILEFFKVWAPSLDNNDPVRYSQVIAKKLGVTINTKLKDIYADKNPLPTSIALK